MPEEPNVTEAGSSPAEGTEAHAETTPVSGETGNRPAARTLDNVYGEFSRKMQKQQETLDAVLQYLASARQPAATAPAQGQQGQATDEELWALAQQGNRQAFEEYQRRIAQQEVATRSQADRTQNMVVSQLNTLVQKYPVLRDASHPLTQHAHQAYAILTQNGCPANQATLLEAAKTAIADRPDLVSEIYSQNAQVREQSRQTASQRAQTGVMGAQHRREPATQQTATKVSPAEQALAARMGIKDPKKAKENFLKRQEDGQSNLGAVAAFVKEDGF